MRPLPILLGVGLVAVTLRAQEPLFLDPQVIERAPPDRAATLTYANRPIVVLRAQVLSRLPEERAAAAARTLDNLVARGVMAPVTTRRVRDAVMITVGDTPVMVILPADVDELAGETLDSTADAAAARLRVALAEAAELRAPGRLLRAVGQVLAATVALLGALWLTHRIRRLAARRLRPVGERPLKSVWGSQVARLTHLPEVLDRVVTLLFGGGALVLAYLWLAFVLRRFPYTRPWGESLRSLLFSQFEFLGASLVRAVPGLLTVLLIMVAARWVNKALRLLFEAAEIGRLSLPGVYPDTAVPTRRLVTALVWLSALAIAYPYIPGSESSGFKGISVFVGVIISLGSTGVVQHLMSGLMLTFARAVRVGDFAKIGDVEGTVLQVGALATKVLTPYGEEVTIPNAVVVSQTTTNLSRESDRGPTLLVTSVTIGYDTPWRQVEMLLLSAAQSTPGVRPTPAPVVWRAALEDYYIKYVLLVAPENVHERAQLRDRLNVRILDAFNQQGVQIMSPHYFCDPAAPKVVPPSHEYAAPAAAARSPQPEVSPAKVASLRS
jgi:small-conductance mechanosensitive channel